MLKQITNFVKRNSQEPQDDTSSSGQSPQPQLHSFFLLLGAPLFGGAWLPAGWAVGVAAVVASALMLYAGYAVFRNWAVNKGMQGGVLSPERVTLRGVDGDVNIKLTQFFNRQALAHIKDFYAEYLAFFADIAKDTFSYLHRFLDFRFRLKLYVKRVRFFIIRNLHKLSLLNPITSNDHSRFRRFFIDGLHKANIELNRKMLSEIAIRDPQSFKQLAVIARNAIGTIKKVVGTER